ncbi:hypothetical protein DID80_06940, partial [Candidatus Marinamargulisbacteria bacterium SCGC AAA071-K20]
MTIKAKNKTFKKKTTLNKKILFPFIIIIIVLAVVSTIVSLYAVSELINNNLNSRLKLEDKYINAQFKTILQSVKTYTKGVQYYRKPASVINKKRDGDALLNSQHFSLFNSLDFLDQGLRDNIKDFVSDTERKDTFSLNFKAISEHPEFQFTYHLKNRFQKKKRVLSSIFTFDQHFFPYFQLDSNSSLVLLFEDSLHDIHSVTNAGLVKERPYLTQLIKKHFLENKNQELPFLSEFNIQNTTYRYLINSVEGFPTLSYVFIVTSNQAFYYKVKLILASLAVL